MIDKILEYDCVVEACEGPEIAVAEMKAQLGYSGFLRKIGKVESDSFEKCRELYRRARDTLLRMGGDATSFPKAIRI